MSKFSIDIDKLQAHAEKEIAKDGYIYPQPDFIRSIPEEYKMFDLEISDKPQDELLNKLSIFTSLLASALVDESKYLAKVASIQRDLDTAKAEVFVRSSAERIRDKEKERDSSPEVVKLQEDLTVADVFLKRYTALRSSYERFAFLYSRALTVQGDERKFSG